MINSISVLQENLGALALPLLLCSLLTLMILIERAAVLCATIFAGGLKHQGAQLLQQYAHSNKNLREEILAIWMYEQQRRLSSGLRLLQIIAMLAPLLGLLGTVLGLIQVFDTLSTVRGSVEVAMLAEGLGMAMKTTAAGLIIAVPALLGAHGFNLWIDKLIATSTQLLNISNLQLEGVCTEALA